MALAYISSFIVILIQKLLKNECLVDALRGCVFIYLPYILKNNVEFQRKCNIMNTKPCISSHNKRIIILIDTKDFLDGPKMAAAAMFSACIALTGHSSFSLVIIKLL